MAAGTRAQRRNEIGHQLLGAAERLMAQGQTFTEIKVEQLAVEAGISRATFYVHFEDKAQLLQYLAAGVFDEMTAESRRWWDVADLQDPATARAAIAGVISTYLRHQALLNAVIEMASYNTALGEAYQLLMGDITDAFYMLIERGLADGTVTSLPASTTARALCWMVERTCHQLLNLPPADGGEEIADTLTEIIWRTLYLRPAFPSP